MARDFQALNAAIVKAVRVAVDPTNTGTPPVLWDGQSANPQTVRWIRASVLFGAGQRVSGRSAASATKGNHVVGVLSVSVFDKPGVGPGASDALLDTIANAFSTVDVSIAHFGAPSGPRDVPGSNQPWAQRVQTIPFTAVEA